MAVSMEYTRKVPVAGAGGPASGGAAAADNRDMAFATVTTKGKEGAQGGSNNVSLLQRCTWESCVIGRDQSMLLLGLPLVGMTFNLLRVQVCCV